MNERQIELVQSSWKKVTPIAQTAGEMFYARLFTIAPEVEPLFKGDIGTQGKKLMAMINTVVLGLKNLDALVPAARELGMKHKQYGVQDKDYSTVGEALLWTLEQGLQDDFDEETRLAWTEAYNTLAGVMQAGAQEAA